MRQQIEACGSVEGTQLVRKARGLPWKAPLWTVIPPSENNFHFYHSLKGSVPGVAILIRPQQQLLKPSLAYCCRGIFEELWLVRMSCSPSGSFSE